MCKLNKDLCKEAGRGISANAEGTEIPLEILTTPVLFGNIALTDKDRFNTFVSRKDNKL